MPIVKLTQKFIDNELQCPPGKARIEYCDSDVRGLYVLVSATSPGRGNYYLRFKVKGKTCHQKIGNTDDTTLHDARNQAKRLKSEIAYGRDPKAEEKAHKGAITLDDFYENHYLPFATPRKRSIKRDKELYVRIKAEFGPSLPLCRITRRQMQTFHTGLLEKEKLAPATCNHHIKLLRRMLSLAVSWEMLNTNPAARFELYAESNMIENYLDKEQLERLLKVLRNHDNRAVCNIALFLLSTGARLNEVLRATLGQFDMENRIWIIPASNSKSKRIRAVPLNDSALGVLDQLDAEEGFVFKNRRTGKPYKNIHKSWCRIKEKAGLPHLRLHDLRHNFASMLVNSGRTLYETQAILGHSNPIVTQRYAHLSTKTLQDAANSASDMIKAAS
jgi:integrase